MSATWRIIEGDCRDVLASLPAGSVHTVVTSPPYFGLRDYGTPGQIGLEPTPDEFVAALVAVFREVRRVLRDDGTVWLNLGDSYMARQFGWNNADDRSWAAYHRENGDERPKAERSGHPMEGSNAMAKATGMKPKDLIGIPWMVAFALRADGWYLRSDIIWSKPNPMPESVTDRPTKAHEYLFLLSKGPRYFYDADAIREADAGTDHPRAVLDEQPSLEPSNGLRGAHNGIRTVDGRNGSGRNKRSVWTVATQPYAGAHFATFPSKLIEPCILAGAPERCCSVCGAPWVRVVERERFAPATPSGMREVGRWAKAQESDVGGRVESRTLGFEPSCSHNYEKRSHDPRGSSGSYQAGDEGPPPRRGSLNGADSAGPVRPDGQGATRISAEPVPGVVLDPFAGAGTTGLVALKHSRSFIGIELNPEYAEMARRRIVDDCPLWNHAAEVTG